MALLACSKSTSKSFMELDGCARRKFMVENNIMPVNSDVMWMNSSTVLIRRGKTGYGFTVSGGAPVRVARVDPASPAAEVGLQAEDFLVKINGINVSRSAADSVAKIIRQAQKQIVVDIHRPRLPQPFAQQLQPAVKTPVRRVLGTLVGPNQQQSQLPLSPYLVETKPRAEHVQAPSCLSDTRMAINGSAASLWQQQDSTYTSESDDSWAFHDDSSLSLESYSERRAGSHGRALHVAPDVVSDLGCSPLKESTRCRAVPADHRPKRTFPVSPDSSYGSQDALDDTLISGNATLLRTQKASQVQCDASSASSNFADDESYDCFERGLSDQSEAQDTPHSPRTPCSPTSQRDGRQPADCSQPAKRHHTCSGSSSASDDVTQRRRAHIHQPTLCYRKLQSSEIERQAAIAKLLQNEKKFKDALTLGLQRFERPLRQAVITKHEHSMLFQNIEMILAISQTITASVKENSEAYCDRASDCFVGRIGELLLAELSTLTTEYELYCIGLKNALSLLVDLKEEKVFDDWLKNERKCSKNSQPMSISNFIQKPLKHITELTLCVQEIAKRTASEHQDYSAIKTVVKALRASCSRIEETHIRRTQSSLSITSSAHLSRSSQSTASSDRSACGSQRSANNSTGSSDGELLSLQERLTFAPHVKQFQLATPSRHVIYSGELVYTQSVRGRSRPLSVRGYLLSDLLLLCSPAADGVLVVEEPPLLLQDLRRVALSASDLTELSLTAVVPDPVSGTPVQRDISLSAPTSDDRIAWKCVLEQRLRSQRGNTSS